MKRFKNWIYLTLGIGVVLGAGLSFDITETQKIDTEINKIDAMQVSELSKESKYKFIPKVDCGDYKCETHWYRTPKNELGYVIYINKIDGDKEYMKVINNGTETYREQDWILIKDNSISATSTK